MTHLQETSGFYGRAALLFLVGVVGAIVTFATPMDDVWGTLYGFLVGVAGEKLFGVRRSKTIPPSQSSASTGSARGGVDTTGGLTAAVGLDSPPRALTMRRTIIDRHARWNLRACLRTYRVRTDFAPSDRLQVCWALFRHGEWT